MTPSNRKPSNRNMTKGKTMNADQKYECEVCGKIYSGDMHMLTEQEYGTELVICDTCQSYGPQGIAYRAESRANELRQHADNLQRWAGIVKSWDSMQIELAPQVSTLKNPFYD
jgi:ribosome-binding protein aMBF1 (putative translation factor)